MLLEREAELAVLDEALRETGAGTGALLVIGGAAGAGTTALLRHLAVLAGKRGARVLRAGGAQIERGFPLGVVRQLTLPLLADEDDDAVPPIARKMLDSLVGVGTNIPPPELPLLATVLHGLHTLFLGLSESRPVVLVDDVHFADEPSLRALAYVAARLGALRVLIGVVLPDGAGARCPLIQEIAATATYRVEAKELSLAATGKLVGAQFGSGYDAEFAAACHEVTGGNAKELRTLLGRAFSHRLRGRAGEAARVRKLGGSFRQERLLFQLRRDPAAEAYAKAAVVLGERAEPWLVARLGGLDEAGCAAARAALEGHWLTVTPRQVAVRDPGMVRVIEESMSAGESASRHRAAAELLTECGYPAEDVAEQLLQVDTLHDGWEIDQLRAAAVAARRRGAPEPATRYLRRALLDLPPGSQERARLLVELAAAELDVDPASAIRHLAQAAPLMPTARDRAAVAAWIPLAVADGGTLVAELVGDVAGHLGPPDTLRGYDRELALRLEARLRYGALDDPVRLATAAPRLAALRGCGLAAERELRAVLLLAGTLSGRMRHDEIVRQATEILDHEPAHTTQPGPALRILPALLAAAESTESVLSWLDAVREHLRRQGNPAATTLVDAQRALVLLSLGRLPEAKEHALRAFTSADPGWQDALVFPAVALGSVAFLLRDRRLARRVLEGTPAAGDLRLFAIRRTLRGALAAGDGDLTAALAQFLDCGRRLDRAGWQNPAVFPWRASAAVFSHRLGRHGEAVRLAEDNHRRALAWGSPAILAQALRIRAAVHGGDEEIRCLREAVDVLEDSANRFEQAKTYLKLGQLLTGKEATVALARGRVLAERSRVAWLQERADALCAAAPESARPELTRAEATVAELAARGRTNAEIAEELGTSRRAVEKHLTSSYRKLRIEGRGGLAGALPDHR